MISEVDINDMKALYDLDNGTYFKLAPTGIVQVPSASNKFHFSGVYKFLGIAFIGYALGNVGLYMEALK